MKEVDNKHNIDFNYREFEEAIQRFKIKGKKSYNFIVKSGTMFKQAIFTFLKRIWKEEDIPKKWEETKLIQVYKGSGSKEKLENKRGKQRQTKTK